MVRAKTGAGTGIAILLVILVVALAYMYVLLSTNTPRPTTVTITSIVTKTVRSGTRTIVVRETITKTTTVVNTVTSVLEHTRTVTRRETTTVTVTRYLERTTTVTKTTTATGSVGGGATSTTTTSVPAARSGEGRSRGVASVAEGPVAVSVERDRLVVRVKGGLEEVAFYHRNESSAIIFPYLVSPPDPAAVSLSSSTLPPLLVDMDRSGVEMIIPLDNVSNDTLVAIWGTGDREIAEFTLIKANNSYLITDFELLEKKPPSVCEALNESGYYTLYALVCGINASSLEAIREALGDVLSGSVPSIAWKLLEWEEKHIKYNGSIEGVETPLEVLEKRMGKCIDYAVFTTAALLAAGVKRVYIGEVFGNGTILVPGHAFAILPYHNTLIVLDQRLPPAELGDYAEHLLPDMLGKDVRTYYIRVEAEPGGGVRIVTGTGIHLPLPDTYPEDRLPASIVRETAYRLARLLGAKPDPRVAQDYRYEVTVTLCRCQLSISLIPPPCLACEVPLTKLYSPIFASYWPDYLASRIYKELRRAGIKPGEYSRVWLTYEQEDTDDIFHVYLG